MRTLRFVFLALALLPAVAQAKLKVLTTTEDLAAIARAVGGERVEVESLTPGAANPHFAEARPSMIRKVSRADALFVVGAGLEVGWLPPLLQNGRNGRVLPGAPGYLDLSTSVELLDKPTAPVSRAQGDVHAQGNPHYWLDPRNGARLAAAMAERLAQLDADGAAEYRARAQRFARQIDAHYPQWRARLRVLQDRPVIAYHTSFVYLARAFGFRIVDQVEPKPGIPPNAAHLARLLARIRAERIPLLIEEPYYERRSGAYLAAQTGIKVAVVPTSVAAAPGIEDYFDLFDAIVAAIADSGVLQALPPS